MALLVAKEAHFVVVDKPCGVSFHSEDGPGFMAQLQDELGEKLHAVHRLDRVTSGLLLFARSPEAASKLGQLFAKREVEKRYLALSDRKPKKKQGTVAGQLQKARRGAWRFGREGKFARTQFHSKNVAEKLRLYLLRPLTGRTHQLRVALKCIGAPILGDRLYGGTDHERTCLHSYRLAFRFDGQAFDFVCPPSEGARFLEEGVTRQLAEWAHSEPRWPKT